VNTNTTPHPGTLLARPFHRAGRNWLRSIILALPISLALVASSNGALYSNGFETNISDWDAFGGGFVATRVPSGTNGITSASGSFHAESSASGSASRWGGYNYGAGNNVPTAFQEYITSVDIFLNVEGDFANNTRFDFSSTINRSNGSYLQDFIFNAGFYNDTDGSPGSGTDRFVIGASTFSQPNNASAKNPANSPIAIDTTGWYTFEHRFYDNAGSLAVDMSIYNSSDALVNNWTLNTTDSIASVGGNRYGWFSYNQLSVLAFDNASLTVVPEPTTALLLLLGSGAMLLLRRRRTEV
jgi:hypothetical protein